MTTFHIWNDTGIRIGCNKCDSPNIVYHDPQEDVHLCKECVE